jgi:signal transduction histidine kinase
VDERIRAVPLFAGLTDDDLDLLGRGAEPITLSAGTELFAEGDVGGHAYVIASGEIEILKETGDRAVRLAVRGPGEVIGEMALLRESPRSSTARALTDTELIGIPRSELEALLDSSTTAVRALFGVVLERWEATESQLRQKDRMAQLGTLTAGLAHELNNPAGAVARAAGQLRRALEELAAADRELTGRLEEGASALLDELRRRAREVVPGPGGLARSDLETEMEELLQASGIEDGWRITAGLVEAGLTPDDARRILTTGGDHAAAMLTLIQVERQVSGLVHQVEEGTRRMSAIIKALRSYAYLDRAPVQDVDVTTGIDDTLLLLTHRLEGIRVVREYAEDLPTIEAVGSELNQVWTNLIDNAACAIVDSGRTDGVIVIRVFCEEDTLVVEVEDNGAGIPPEATARVFDSFFTTKPPGSGTGLGLSISYEIVVHEHRGDIGFTSEPGRTVFRVEIPMTGEDPSEDAA